MMLICTLNFTFNAMTLSSCTAPCQALLVTLPLDVVLVGCGLKWKHTDLLLAAVVRDVSRQIKGDLESTALNLYKSTLKTALR